MLRTNLATRPFYNERLVHWLLGLAAVAVIAFTAFNLTEYLRVSGRQGGLEAEAVRDETLARQLSAKAAQTRQRIDPKSLERISADAALVNGIIDARTFSWSALFEDVEATLPPNVMLTAITPAVSADGATVSFMVAGKSVEAIDTFIERLEATTHFSRVQVQEEAVVEVGSIEARVTGRYAPPAAASKPGTGTPPEAATPAPAPAPASAAPAGPGRQGAR
jgi:Tfp pilus assembly protein PilN